MGAGGDGIGCARGRGDRGRAGRGRAARVRGGRRQQVADDLRPEVATEEKDVGVPPHG